MEKINPITAILIIVFIYPIIRGFLFKYSSKDMKLDLEELNRSISFIASLYLGIYYSKKIFIQHDGGIYRIIYEIIPVNIIRYIESKPFIIYIIIVPIIIFLIYKLLFLILYFLNTITLYPLLDVVESYLRKKSNIFRSVIGALFQFPKAVGYILLVTLMLNILSIFYTNEAFNKYLESSNTYNYVCKKVVIPVTNSKLARKLPDILNNSFKIVVKESQNIKDTPNKNISGKTIVYYNGVTLNEGVKSNNEINIFAKGLVEGESSTKGKAKILYNWIGNNISYDHDKAVKVLNNDFDVRSGAISTFQTKKGICFDYACLYVAMCRVNNIKVRLITGQGFNGVSWVSHAWNQVYIQEENKWINVDTTFYKGGNYFNSRRFELDHKDYNIAGEW
ncbi:transglutaminase-like domain-containing protein [Clostridium rectalis]|uniref:transglutaminase-like domain-containing protein n=1 Tax=Clostridium rectalis TaxID=2040295 RepID=UPI000F645139|nr:transglutaminase-like domain-containing protein [Clostridium rectalis]